MCIICIADAIKQRKEMKLSKSEETILTFAVSDLVNEIFFNGDMETPFPSILSRYQTQIKAITDFIARDRFGWGINYGAVETMVTDKLQSLVKAKSLLEEWKEIKGKTHEEILDLMLKHETTVDFLEGSGGNIKELDEKTVRVRLYQQYLGQMMGILREIDEDQIDIFIGSLKAMIGEGTSDEKPEFFFNLWKASCCDENDESKKAEFEATSYYANQAVQKDLSKDEGFSLLQKAFVEEQLKVFQLTSTLNRDEIMEVRSGNLFTEIE